MITRFFAPLIKLLLSYCKKFAEARQNHFHFILVFDIFSFILLLVRGFSCSLEYLLVTVITVLYRENLAIIRFFMFLNCFVSSVYRIYVVALGSDPQYGDSLPSNVLTVCAPVVQESIMRRRPSGGVIRPPFDVTVNVLSTSNTSISIEWTHPAEIGNERRKKLKSGTCHLTLRPCTNSYFFLRVKLRIR